MQCLQQYLYAVCVRMGFDLPSRADVWQVKRRHLLNFKKVIAAAITFGVFLAMHTKSSLQTVRLAIGYKPNACLEPPVDISF